MIHTLQSTKTHTTAGTNGWMLGLPRTMYMTLTDCKETYSTSIILKWARVGMRKSRPLAGWKHLVLSWASWADSYTKIVPTGIGLSVSGWYYPTRQWQRMSVHSQSPAGKTRLEYPVLCQISSGGGQDKKKYRLMQFGCFKMKDYER